MSEETTAAGIVEQQEPEVLIESNINLPNHRRIVRCIDAEYKLSQKSGKPMVQFTWEIVRPQVERIGNNHYQTAGLRATNWLMLDRPSVPNARQFINKLNLDDPFNYDSPNVEALKGICLEVTGGSKKKAKEEQTYNEKGEMITQALIDPLTGKPVIEYNYSFNLTNSQFGTSDVLRRVSSDETEMPF